MEKENHNFLNKPPKKHGNDCAVEEYKDIVPEYLTNSVTDATSKGKGNTPIPSEQSVLEAKKFVDSNEK